MHDGLAGKLILRPVGSEGEPITLKARVGTPARTVLPCATTWEVTLQFPESWGPRVKVAASTTGEPVTSRLALWPMGKIAGSVKLAAPGERFPKTLTVTTLAPRGPNLQPPPKGKMDCPVDAKGRWTCALPAATYDLTLTAEGFSPQYRWGQQVLPGKVGDVGSVELKRGASVTGWVVVEDGTLDAGACRARLAPLIGPGSGAQIAEKIQRTALEARVGKDGFFQFGAVPPGTYSLEVRQKGFAPQTLSPIEVYARSETQVRDPVLLKRPFQIELAISPPLDWLDQRWKVALFRESPATGTFRDDVYHGAADTQGVVTVPGQAPGRFQLTISDSRDNSLFSKILNLGPAEARQSIDLELLTIRGTLQLGKEPLAATLWFGGHFGGASVQLESDSDGKFHGVLPKDGWWIVDVDSPSPRFQLRTRAKVEPAGHDRGTVDIVLPSTHLFGKVVMDDTGQPASSAHVSLSTDEASLMSQTTDETGAFEWRGMPAGTLYAGAQLSSSKGTWTSDRAVFTVGEGEDHGPVELRLKKTRQVAGIVQSAGGPVPGAGIVVVPFRPIVMFGDRTRTDLDGSFTGQVPAMIETAAAVVSAPGFALRAFALTVGETPQTLPVSAEGGSLELLFPDKLKDSGKDESSLWIFQNGLPIPPDTLYQWAAGHGNPPGDLSRNLAVPEMAPGEYRACSVAQAVVVAWEASGWTAPLAKCATGQLAPGGTLRLDLSKL